MSGILDGISVLDFTHVWQGPLSTQILGDFGANVIKVERPGRGDWTRGYGPYRNNESLVFAGLNRNKRSIVVDMSSAEGKEVVRKILEHVDVVVNNFRPGVEEKMGLDYDSVKKVNPSIIHAHSSGWGDEGPYVERRRGGHAKMAQATGGLFFFPENGSEPIPSGISIDYPTGLLLTIGIVMALYNRQKTGMGEKVTTDLLSAAVYNHVWKAGRILNSGNMVDGDENLGATEMAIKNCWRTSDSFIEISPVFSDDFLRDLCYAMEIEDLSADERFSKPEYRLTNRDELNLILGDEFLKHTTSEWIAKLEPHKVLCAEIKTPEEALNDPQVIANGMVIEMVMNEKNRIKLLGNPVRLRNSPAEYKKFPPTHGENTIEVLLEVGFSQKEIELFLENKVVFGPVQSLNP